MSAPWIPGFSAVQLPKRRDRTYLKAGAPTKSIEYALSQHPIFTVEMVTAGGPDHFRLSQEGRTGTVLLVGAVETLNHGQIDRRERRFGCLCLLAGAGPHQSGDTDLEIGCRGKSEERQLNDVRL